MELLDSVNGKEPGPAGEQSGPAAALGRSSVDRLEFSRAWVQQKEEQQVEETMNLYARAVRQRMQPEDPETLDSVDSEELESLSQQLKLQQKCQDIAALMMVEEMEEEE